MTTKGFCKNCLKHFTKEVPFQKYCSKNCQNEYLNSSILKVIKREKKIEAAQIKAVKIKTAKIEIVKKKDLTCRYCHGVIKFYMGSKLFCSKKCQSYYKLNIPLGESIKHFCGYCKKQFVPKEDEITRFCSVDCRRAMQNKVSGYRID